MTVTATAALPSVPSLAAVIVAAPGATPVTSPAFETVATVMSLLSHVTGGPVRGLPAESFSVAVSCIVSPTARSPAAGDTSTEATAADETGPMVSTARQLIAAYAAVTKAAERRTTQRRRFTPGQGRTTTSRTGSRVFMR